MLLALFVALASVLLGAVLGITPGVAPWGRALRTFATVSAVALVLGHIVPDALAHGGIGVLAVVVAFFLVPTVFERLSHSFLPSDVDRESRWVLELGFWGLLAHKVGDGIGVGTYSTGMHAGHAHWEVHLAIAAHTVPIVAVMVGALSARLGRRAAWFRTLLLMAAVAGGVVATGSLLETVLAPWEPWILAAVGGLLLHVVSHVHGTAQASSEPPRRVRILELIAAALGVGVLLLGTHHQHHDGGHEARDRVFQAFLELSLESAPALLFGLLVGAGLQLWGAFIPMRWLHGGNSMSQALRAALVGVPIPICSCGVLPVVESLRRRGATAAVVTSFLFAAPELGVETFALTVQFFGWSFALVRLAAALLVAVLAAVAFAAVVPRRPGALEDAAGAGDERYVTGAVSKPVWARFSLQFHDLLAHIGPWTFLGLVVAAYASVAVADSGDGLTTGSLLADVVVVTALAIPSYVCAASATPLAAVLVMQGFSPGAALVGLLLGPATNVATFGYLSKTFGLRATGLGLFALLAVAWTLALALDGVLRTQAIVRVPALEEHGIRWFSSLCLALLLGAILVGIWRRGLGRWFGALSPLGFDPRPHHDHGGPSAVTPSCAP